MTPLQILVVDDEALARSRLRRLLAECTDPPAEAVAEAASAVEAMSLLQARRFDAVLLDIHMPGADGMQLARQLRELPQAPPVVFVTAHAEHAVRAFELEALDYLTKPVRVERLCAALQKVKRKAESTSRPAPDSTLESLLIVERGSTVRVPLSDVLYLKAELKYVTVRTATAEHLFDGSLNQLEERYPGRFLRIHRNALVQRGALRALQRDATQDGEWVVRLTGLDEPLSVSRRQLAAVREALGP